MSVDRDCESEVVLARRRVVRAGWSGALALGGPAVRVADGCLAVVGARYELTSQLVRKVP
ncbi:hypothetical protein [Streptomyces sp. NPDC059389]|uniref:hypothetical protein n=1 Tax=Streptomyces sp. NPDC059389 TaxID=3346818 RepID=UPI0036B181DB